MCQKTQYWHCIPEGNGWKQNVGSSEAWSISCSNCWNSKVLDLPQSLHQQLNQNNDIIKLRISSSVMWYNVVRYKFTSVLEERTASIFKFVLHVRYHENLKSYTSQYIHIRQISYLPTCTRHTAMHIVFNITSIYWVDYAQMFSAYLAPCLAVSETKGHRECMCAIFYETLFM